MSDLLKERLQAQVQDLPVRVRGAATVRRDAELGQRRRRIAAAALVAVLALVVGTGALLGATGDRVAGPPAEQTPTPSVTEVGGAFVAVSELPTAAPYGAWTGRTEAKFGDDPLCLSQWPQAAVTARRYRSGVPGQDGYQAVLVFPSADDAQSAVAIAKSNLFACGNEDVPPKDIRVDSGAVYRRGGYIIRTIASPAAPRSEIVVYAQSSQFVSLLWLAARGRTPPSSELTHTLVEPVAASLRAATDRLPRPALTGLAAAMLGPANIRSDVAGAHLDLNNDVDPFGFSTLHPCDVDAADSAPQRQVSYSGSIVVGNGEIGQRVIVAPDPERAQSIFTTLVTGMRGCPDVIRDGAPDIHRGDDLHLARIGDEAAGWTFVIRWPGAASVGIMPTRLVVAVVRSGRAVMQVSWQGSAAGRGMDATQFEDLLVRGGFERVVSELPDVAASTSAATP